MSSKYSGYDVRVALSESKIWSIENNLCGGGGGVMLKQAAHFKQSWFQFGWPRPKKSFADKLLFLLGLVTCRSISYDR